MGGSLKKQWNSSDRQKSGIMFRVRTDPQKRNSIAFPWFINSIPIFFP